MIQVTVRGLQPVHLTSSQGHKRLCVHSWLSRGRGFHSEAMTSLHPAALWWGPHPGWCFGFLSIPRWDFRHFPKARSGPRSAGQVASYLCCYCGALAAALSYCQCVRSFSTFGRNEKVQAFLLLTRSYVLDFPHFIIPTPFFNHCLVFSICIVWVWDVFSN